MDRYEDFDAWKLAKELNDKVFAMTERPLKPLDFKWRANLRDAADSAERNFPEGFGRFAPADFARFLDHSRSSLLETENELRVGLRRGWFTTNDVREALILVKRALGALSGLQRYLRSPRASENARRARERFIKRSPRKNAAKPPGAEPANQRTDEPTNQRTDEPTN